jgi:FAD/FMN-containing dehydrogenase
VAISMAALDGGRTSIDGAAADELSTKIRGDVLKRGDPGYSDHPTFDAMHARHPALIVRCAGTADVVDAVKFARRHGILVSVRGGGHSLAGHSSCDGGIVIDLVRMRGVEVDAEARIVRVQGGALWADVDRATWENETDNEANIAWVRESFRQVAPYSTGTTYTNFTGQAEETAGSLAATAYGANMARLRFVKAQYDPDNFFRLNPNLVPVSGEPV